MLVPRLRKALKARKGTREGSIERLEAITGRGGAIACAVAGAQKHPVSESLRIIRPFAANATRFGELESNL